MTNSDKSRKELAQSLRQLGIEMSVGAAMASAVTTSFLAAATGVAFGAGGPLWGMVAGGLTIGSMKLTSMAFNNACAAVTPKDSPDETRPAAKTADIQPPAPSNG